MDVSRRSLFSLIAGAGAGMVAGRVEAGPVSTAESTPLASFPLEGREICRVSWFNRARGFGYMEGLSSFHRIFLSQAIVEQGGMETVRPGQTLDVYWKIQREPDWTERIKSGETPTIPARKAGEHGCIAYDVRPTEPQQGTCFATLKWYQNVREFGFLNEGEGHPDIWVRKRLFDEAGIANPMKGMRVWVYWKCTHRGRTAFELRAI